MIELREWLIVASVVLLAPLQEKPPVPPTPPADSPDLVARLGDQRWTHGERAQSVAFRPDGAMAASGGWGNIKLWDVKTGKLIRSIATERWSMGSIRFSPDGKRIAGAPTDGKIGIWDVETGNLEKVIDLSGRDINRAQVFSADLKRILSGTQEGRIQLWDVENEKSLVEIEGAGRILGLGMSPDAKWIVTGSYTGKNADIWDAESGKKVGQFPLGCHNCTRVQFSPDGKRILLGAWSNAENLTLWEFEPRRKIHAFETGWVDSIAYSADGTRVAAGDLKNTVTVWEAESGRRLHSFTDLKARIMGMEFSPDGKTLFAITQGGALGLWNVETGALVSDTDGHRGGVMSIAFMADQRSVWTAGNDGRLIRWDLATGKVIRRMQEKSQSPLCASFSADRRVAVFGSQDGPLSAWDLEKGEATRELGSAFCRSVGISPDGRLAFARGKKMKDLSIWDLATGEAVRTIRGFTYDAWALAMSPDGRFVAAGTMHDQEGKDPGTLTLWDARTGERLWSMWGSKGKYSQIQVITFSPDARQVLCTSMGSISVFDVRDGQRIVEIPANPKATILSMAVSPDGRLGVCGTYDKKVVLWDATTGKIEREFTGHAGPVTSVAFSPGGRHFISGSEDGTVLMWRPGRELASKAADWASVWKKGGEADRKTGLAAEFAKLGREFEVACEARERLLALGEDVIAGALAAYPPLDPSVSADGKRLDGILRGLESDDLAERSRAAIELELGGKAVLPWIKAKLEKGGDLAAEARRTLENIRDRLADATFSMVNSGMVRAVMLLLEMTDSGKAREALERYALGPAWHYPAHVARHGLGR